ncbi:MAG: hypothetical protein ACP5LG_07805 [Conexivisphaera sp.]
MLRFSLVTVKLLFPNGAKIAPWMGSALRGGLGQALHRYVCRAPACPFCSSSVPCLFRGAYLHRRAKRGFSEPPKPLSLISPLFEEPVELPPEGEFYFDVLLLGDYTSSFRQLVAGLRYLGMLGLLDVRHYGLNRFLIEGIADSFTGRVIYDGSVLLSEPPVVDASDILPVPPGTYVISSRTPFTGPLPPLTLGGVLKESWRRLVMLVNEYGDGSSIPKPSDDGPLDMINMKEVILRRRSMRSDKSMFRGWMLDASVDLSEASEASRRIIAMGSLLGMGSDFSFGLGFYSLIDAHSTHKVGSFQSPF